jgi:SNF2 family DNA or RNA helicase
LQSLQIEKRQKLLDGQARLFKLGLEALRISVAQEFDPYFGLSISRIDPLPHQLDAVYNHLLKSARCWFLLADDAGAGKTIMAGLLLKEMKLRGLIERVLIICPANLAFQWQREMADRFQETFRILRGGDCPSTRQSIFRGGQDQTQSSPFAVNLLIRPPRAWPIRSTGTIGVGRP